jgi:hypothetical protein
MHWAAVDDDEIDGTGSKEPLGEPVAVDGGVEAVVDDEEEVTGDEGKRLATAFASSEQKSSDACSRILYLIVSTRSPQSAALAMKISGIAPASAASTALVSAAVSALVRIPPSPAYVRKVRPSELPIADISAPARASLQSAKAVPNPVRAWTPLVTNELHVSAAS